MWNVYQMRDHPQVIFTSALCQLFPNLFFGATIEIQKIILCTVHCFTLKIKSAVPTYLEGWAYIFEKRWIADTVLPKPLSSWRRMIWSFHGIRPHNQDLMMGTELVPETSIFNKLTRLIAREGFIKAEGGYGIWLKCCHCWNSFFTQVCCAKRSMASC
jgi:hypothetical protein